MPTISVANERAIAPPVRAGWRPVLHRYMTLTKARLSALVLLTTLVGFTLGAEALPVADASTLIGTLLAALLGTAMAAGAASTFNQVIETRRDRLMDRTRNRPLPAGTVGTTHALAFAGFLAVGGVAVLALLVNPLAAGLALLTIAIYVLLYTPLKTITSLNTLVGAVCGAIPPMIGWVAATGTLDAGAWALGGLLFVWQIPHFLALAWLYRDDYARGGFAMLPVFDRTGQLTCQVVVITSLLLVPTGLTATLLGLAGWFYTAGSILLGLGLLALGVRLYLDRTHANARRVFLASLVYLTAMLALLVFDRGSVAISGSGPAPMQHVAAKIAITE